jgi:hypothetical protein
MERDSQLLHTSAYVSIRQITQLELREAAEQRGVYEDLPELDVQRYYFAKYYARAV